MDRSRRAAVYFVLLAAAFLTTAAWAQTPTKYILQTTASANSGLLASRYRFTIERNWAGERHVSYAITAATAFTASEIQSLTGEPGVLELEADSRIQAGGEQSIRTSAVLETLNEQLLVKTPAAYFGSAVRVSYVDQPATRLIGLPKAQTGFPTGAGVVAIIDTGVDEKHPALKNVLLPGYDFTRNLAGTASEMADLDRSTSAILDQSTVAILDSKSYPLRLSQSTVAILDQSTVAILDGKQLPAAFGHGTMVAGLVHLIAPTARILPLKAFRGDGSSSLSDIVRAVYYAVDHGADVISMSFNLNTPSIELASAIAYATNHGVLCVASAGNDGQERKVYPATLPKVIGVSSTNYSDKRSPFSNYGDSAKVAAPGEAVITTFPGNNYAGAWGTSFSTPMVAGALAIMRQVDPKLSYSGAMGVLEHGLEVSGDVGTRLLLPAAFSECANNRK